MRKITSRLGVLGSLAGLIGYGWLLGTRIDAQTSPRPKLIHRQSIEHPAESVYCSSRENGRFGHSLVMGDLDGDGRDDLLVAASGSRPGRPGAFIFYSTGNGYAEGHETRIQVAADQVGMADVNGDGFKDAVLVANSSDIYVFHGGPLRFPEEMSGATANWSKSVPSEFSGNVATIDVNADGIDDIIVGGVGKAQVFYGSPAGLPASGLPDVVINEYPNLADNTGTDGLHYSISGSFKAVTRDGKLCDATNPQTPCGSQFAIGVPGTDVDFNGSGYVEAGERNVGIALVGPRWQFLAGDKVPSVEFGYQLGHGGDVNGDGETELIVSAKPLSNLAAKVFVYLGKSVGFAKMEPDYAWAVEAPPGGRFVMFGAAVGGAGDINGDGYGDIFIGDPRFDNVGGRPQASLGSWGRAFVFLGGPPSAGDPSGLGPDPTPAAADITLPGSGISGEFAYAFAHGDVNGDGATDIVVGDPRGGGSCLDSPGQQRFTDVGITWVYLADVDRDGDGRTGVSGNDCDDHDSTTFPGATEIFDGKDNDCDGEVDDGVTGALVDVLATDASAAEAGRATGTLTLIRSGETITDALTVSYLVSGSATAGSDYAALSGTATFPANALSTTITVTPIDDTLIETVETVTVTVTLGAGYRPGASGSASVIITSDDRPQVTIATTDATATEAGPTRGTFIVTRTGSTASALTVFYSIEGTATNGSDYLPLPSILTIPAHAASAPITVTPLADAPIEGAETVTVTLSASPAYLVGTPNTGTVTIAGHETVSIVATDPTATEAGLTTGQFTVRRTGTGAAPLTVFYTVAGSAMPFSDYKGLGSSVTIPANATSAVIMVRPWPDITGEGTETVSLQLSPNGAYIVGAPSVAVVLIVDDDYQ